MSIRSLPTGLEGSYHLGEVSGSEECGLRVRLGPVTQCEQGPRPPCPSPLLVTVTAVGLVLNLTQCHPHAQGCLERGKTPGQGHPETLPGEELRELGAHSVLPQGGLFRRTKFCSYLCWQSQTHTSRLRSSLPPEPEEQTTRQTGPKPCGCAVVHYDFRFLLRPADPNAFIHRQSSRSHSARGPIFLPERHSPSLALTMAPPSPPPSPNLLITHSNIESSDSKSGC